MSHSTHIGERGGVFVGGVAQPPADCATVRFRYSVWRFVAALDGLGATLSLASPTVGVGHNPQLFAALRLLLPLSSPVPPPQLTGFTGVGNIIGRAARAARFSVARPLLWRPAEFFHSRRVTVGQNPKSLAMVWGANVVGSQHAPVRIVPRFGQITEDSPKIFVPKKSRHVFQERESGSYFANDPNCVGPEVALIVHSLTLASYRKRLARYGKPAVMMSIFTLASSGSFLRLARLCLCHSWWQR